MMSQQAARNDQAYYLLRALFFIGPFIAGVDKFFHLLTNWDQYLSPAIARLLPVSGHTFMLAVGVIEIVASLLVLFGMTRLGGYIVGLWLLGIVVNLVSMGAFYDVALRDLGLALAAFSLARLSEARSSAWLPVGRTSPEVNRPVAA